jgi:hypothetical protein
MVQTNRTVPQPHLFAHTLGLDGESPAAVCEAAAFARRLVARFGLTSEDLVVEVGSNDGTRLQAVRELGPRVLGVEPAVRVLARAFHAGVDTVGAFFDENLARYLLTRYGSARVVLVGPSLSAAPDLPGFLSAAAELLTPDGVLVAEVPFAAAVARSLGIEYLHHGSPCAFTVGSLQRLAVATGLELDDADDGPAGSCSVVATFRQLGSAPGPGPGPVPLPEREGVTRLTRPRGWDQFVGRVARARVAVRAELERLALGGVRVVGCSATPAAAALLHALRIGPGELPAVIDPNPWLRGLYFAGTRIPVRGPDAVAELRPGVLVILDRTRAADAVGLASGRPVRVLQLLPQPHFIRPPAERRAAA